MNVIRMKQLKVKLGLGQSTLFRKIATGDFPKPFPLGEGRAKGWLETDVDDWLRQQRGPRLDS